MKTSINFATYRNENGFPRKQQTLSMLESIKGKADTVRCYFNGVIVKPFWMPDWVDVTCGSGVDLTDLGKFYFLEPDMDEIYLTVDDDLFYPETYVDDMVNAVHEHECVVSHHGRKLVDTATDYYRTNPAMRCLGGELFNRSLDVPGTGVMAFDTNTFNPYWMKTSMDRKMSDLTFALECAKHNVPIIGLRHEMEYITYLNPPVNETIHQQMHGNQTRLIEVANQIKQIKKENGTWKTDWSLNK